MLECLFGVLLFEVERWIKLGTSKFEELILHLSVDLILCRGTDLSLAFSELLMVDQVSQCVTPITFQLQLADVQ